MQLTTLDLLRIRSWSNLLAEDRHITLHLSQHPTTVLRAGKLSQTKHPLFQLRALSVTHPAVAWHSALPAICPVLQLL